MTSAHTLASERRPHPGKHSWLFYSRAKTFLQMVKTKRLSPFNCLSSDTHRLLTHEAVLTVRLNKGLLNY